MGGENPGAKPRPGTREWRELVLAEHPRAYEPWTAAEDQALRMMFAMGASLSAMSEQHERRRGGIRSRLKHLGLTDPAPDLSADELHAELRRLLHSIGGRSRALVIAAFIDGLPSSDLAARFELDVNHVRDLADRALDRLGRAVLSEGSPELRTFVARAGRFAGPCHSEAAPVGTNPRAVSLLAAVAGACGRVGRNERLTFERVDLRSRAPLVQQAHGRT